MTAQTIVDKARELLNDPNKRWTDSFMLNSLTDGLEELWRKRPDAFFATEVLSEKPTFPTTLAGDVTGLMDWAIQPLVYFLGFKCMLQDSEHAANAQLAANYRQEFYSVLL